MSGLHFRLLLVLLVCFGPAVLRADVPAPKPNIVTVSNLTAFPAYQFSYGPADDPAHSASPLPDGKPVSYVGKTALYVRKGKDALQAWTRLEFSYMTGRNTVIKVESVQEEKGKIRVEFKQREGSAKSAAYFPALPFLLSGTAALGLVMLARRKSSRI